MTYFWMLLLGGLIAGIFRFFEIYLKSPNTEKIKTFFGSTLKRNYKKGKWSTETSLAFISYILISGIGAFLTYVIDRVISLPGLENNTDTLYLIWFLYALLFGYLINFLFTRLISIIGVDNCNDNTTIENRIKTGIVKKLAPKNKFGTIESEGTIYLYYNYKNIYKNLESNEEVHFFSCNISEIKHRDFRNFEENELLAFNLHIESKKNIIDVLTGDTIISNSCLGELKGTTTDLPGIPIFIQIYNLRIDSDPPEGDDIPPGRQYRMPSNDSQEESLVDDGDQPPCDDIPPSLFYVLGDDGNIRQVFGESHLCLPWIRHNFSQENNNNNGILETNGLDLDHQWS